MLRSSAFLVLCVAPAGALRLLVSTPAPTVTRSAAVRMQLGEQTTEATEAAATTVGGKVVPTAMAMSASSRALMDAMIAEKPELGISFRRAEFWANTTVTLLEVINVLGRFDSCAAFRERTDFSTVENSRVENEQQAETKNRHEMALRMGCAERVGLYQIAPTLPFTNAALAASIGKSVEDFEGLEVSKAACNTVYDALAESRSGLIPYATLDARRGAMLNEDGSFNELAFRSGLYKSRGLIIFAWFLFGKGNFVWVLVAAKLLHDWRPDIIPTPAEMGLFKIGTFI